MSASSSYTCQTPDLASSVENIFAPLNFARISSTFGSGYLGRLIALFRSVGPKQTRRLPLGFFPKTRLKVKSVGSVTFLLFSLFPSLVIPLWVNLAKQMVLFFKYGKQEMHFHPIKFCMHCQSYPDLEN